jgi:orotidine-5'-phosphate decarboxylase
MVIEFDTESGNEEIKMTPEEREAASRVIVALDGINQVRPFREDELSMYGAAHYLGSLGVKFKVGMEAFSQFGPEAVQVVRQTGGGVFLDLKHKDIPRTVAGAVRKDCRLGVEMLNIHLDGGPEMIRAAVEAAAEYGENRPKVLGVTVLTSSGPAEVLETDATYAGQFQPGELKLFYKLKPEDERNEAFCDLLRKRGLARFVDFETNTPTLVQQQVNRLARIGADEGVDGIICSAADLSYLKEHGPKMPEGFLYVTPGIRFAGGDVEDQTRVLTPGRAIGNGSTHLVIGSSIMKAPTMEARVENAYRAVREVAAALHPV